MHNYTAVQSILPHRDPAVVVDGIVGSENGAVRCTRTVRENEHYGPGLSPEGIIEFCAQAALYKEMHSSDQAPKLGVIAGIDDFAFFSAADVGDELAAEVSTQTKFGNLLLFECTVRRGGETVAHGFIKAALT